MADYITEMNGTETSPTPLELRIRCRFLLSVDGLTQVLLDRFLRRHVHLLLSPLLLG
jgi:hypothetical protein